jgi:hypothetical protein
VAILAARTLLASLLLLAISGDHIFSLCSCSRPERIERFIEGQAFSRSSDAAPPPPPPPLPSVSYIGGGRKTEKERGEKGLGEELNHTTARKPGPP